MFLYDIQEANTILTRY